MPRASAYATRLVAFSISVANLLSFALIVRVVVTAGRRGCGSIPLYLTHVAWDQCGTSDAVSTGAQSNGTCVCVAAGRRYMVSSIVADTLVDRVDARDLVALLLALAYAGSFVIGVTSNRGAWLPSVGRDPNPPQWPLLVEHSITQPLVVAAMCVACGVRDLAVVLSVAALSLSVGAIHATVDAMRYSCCDLTKPSWSNWTGSIVFAQSALVAVTVVMWVILYATVTGGGHNLSAASHVDWTSVHVLLWGTIVLHGAYIATQFAQMYIYYDHDVLKGQSCTRSPDPSLLVLRRTAPPVASRSTTLVRVAYPLIITANRSLVATVALWNPRRRDGLL